VTVLDDLSEPKTLLIPMMDFPAELEDESNRWFDSDHVPERLSCDGIIACSRFQLTGIEPYGWTPAQRWTKYLNVYTLRSADVLTSPAYLLQRDMNGGRGSSWRQERELRQLEQGRSSPSRSLRTVWMRRPSPWQHGVQVKAIGPRVIYVVLRDVDEALDDAFNDCMDNEYIPELLSTPGFTRCERYAAGTPLQETAGRPRLMSQPRYLDIYDLTTPEVATSRAYALYLRSVSDTWRRLEAAMSTRGSGVYLQRPSPWLLELGDTT